MQACRATAERPDAEGQDSHDGQQCSPPPRGHAAAERSGLALLNSFSRQAAPASAESACCFHGTPTAHPQRSCPVVHHLLAAEARRGSD